MRNPDSISFLFREALHCALCGDEFFVMRGQEEEAALCPACELTKAERAEDEQEIERGAGMKLSEMSRMEKATLYIGSMMNGLINEGRIKDCNGVATARGEFWADQLEAEGFEPIPKEIESVVGAIKELYGKEQP